MIIISTQSITMTKVQRKGTNRVEWNYDLNGVPFGQVWTFNSPVETHPYHAKPLNGEYKAFDRRTEADAYMRGCM